MAEPKIANGEHYRIMRAYAYTSADVSTIAEEQGLSRDYVAGILVTLCALNRQTAKTRVVEYERTPRAAKLASAAATPAAAPAPPVQPQIVTAVVASPIEELLGKAEASEYKRIANLGGRIRAMVADLERRLALVEVDAQAAAEAAQERAKVQARIAKLEKELAAEKAKLKPRKAVPRG